MSQFRAYVHTASGRPLPNVAIRVTLAVNEQDFTAQLLGRSDAATGADGLYTVDFPGSIGPLGNTNYYIRFSAPGYELNESITANTFTGVVSLDITMVPIATVDVVEIPETAFRYVSTLYPTEIEVAAQSPGAAWELISTIITDESGTPRLLEVPVVGGSARINLQARMQLTPRLHLVGDGVPAVIDPDFSGAFSFIANSITESGSVDLEGDNRVVAALLAPAGEVNDLSNYTNDNENGVARWITPWTGSFSTGHGLPKYRGHYADAMIWLPVTLTGAYTLKVTYYDINGQSIVFNTVALDATLFATGKPVRIRIPEAEPGAHFATLAVWQGGTNLTNPPLNVRFIDGY